MGIIKRGQANRLSHLVYQRSRVNHRSEAVAHGGTGDSPVRGSALLAVLWLSLALSAIAFSLATTVHGETERTSTAVDGIRSYYLATGAIERAILYMQWGKQFYSAATPVLRMSFPTGDAEVEVIPETAKYNINHSKPEDLMGLLVTLGTRVDQAQDVVNAIVDWRTPGGISAFDQYYLSLVPSFRARHASFEEIEELLVLRGMTTDLYYGTYDRDAAGKLFRRGGLNECLSVYGAVDRFDANTAHPAVLASLGLSPQQVQSLVERLRRQPFLNDGDVANYTQGVTGRLRVGGNSIFTLRATARLRLQDGKLSDMRRSVGAMVKMMPAGYSELYHIMRWYDNAWRD
jgi:general secretion pathway protein K